MKYTQVAPDAFKKIQFNAGILLDEFDPDNPPETEQDRAEMRGHIIGATGGGVSFEATTTFTDFGEDIDNVPKHTMELKQIDEYEVKLSGTFRTIDTELSKRLIAAADVYGNKVIPRQVLTVDDFADVWWVGDYSDVTTGVNAGFIAIRIINALSSGGFSLVSGDKNKAEFKFEFTGHYSMEDTEIVPFEIYIQEGSTTDVSLASLSIGALTLTPSFDKDVTDYTATTTNASNIITATATDSSAQVVIKNGTTTISSGSSATWETGENTVTITVTNDGSERVYTVIVTKED